MSVTSEDILTTMHTLTPPVPLAALAAALHRPAHTLDAGIAELIRSSRLVRERHGDGVMRYRLTAMGATVAALREGKKLPIKVRIERVLAARDRALSNAEIVVATGGEYTQRQVTHALHCLGRDGVAVRHGGNAHARWIHAGHAPRGAAP